MESNRDFGKTQNKDSPTIRSVPISTTKAKDYTNFLNISTKLNGVGGSKDYIEFLMSN